MSDSSLLLFAGIILGAVATGIPFFIIMRMRVINIRASALSEVSSEMGVLRERLSSNEDELRRLREETARLGRDLSAEKSDSSGLKTSCKMQEQQIGELKGEIKERDKRIEELNALASRYNGEIKQIETQLDLERKQAEEKLNLLSEAKDQLRSEFQNLANTIFDEKSKRFSEQSKTSLDLVLTPLKDQLGEFRKRVDDVYTNDTKERQSLFEQIKALTTLNQQVSKDAENLTRALKGESKTQGNWGEMILERALELSGLKKGVEYDTQFNATDEEGRRFLPDVVVHLPEGRDIIVDSKVSLKAYELAVSAESEESRDEALTAHLASVRSHIDGLSGKSYDLLVNVNTLDYVLMFMPIEAAFVCAIQRDPSLFEYAYRKRIILVSPATLLVTLRTIQNMWQSEYQNRNSQEIARKAADLYDKFAGFVDTIADVKKAIGSASDKCETAIKQLSTGKGNVVKRIEEFRNMGVKPRKTLPSNLLETDDAREAAETDEEAMEKAR